MCRDSIINSKLFCQQIFVIVSQLIKPSPYTSLAWGRPVSVELFNDKATIKEKYSVIRFCQKNSSHSNINNNQSTNLWNQSTLHSAPHPFLMEKGA
jgi:hypothetical protein